MKILFVENQYKTYFFEPIALKLQEKGHEIYWLVQNKMFKPKHKFDNVYVLPTPKKKNYPKIEDADIDAIIYSDRNINYFKRKDKGYFYFFNEKIKEYVHSTQPDIAFGESTLFHELMTGMYCKRMGVKYLNPLPCRYPTGKFSFYLYDTLEPYKGCNEDLSEEKVAEIIDNIVNRTISPDYMKPLVMTPVEKIINKLEKTAGYYMGDKFNTPSPLVKLSIEKEKERTIERWNSCSINAVTTKNAFNVLYPLQVQPEENIDVWGRKRRNQLAVIKEIVANLSEDAVLYVKPNPKPRYEVDNEMIDFVSTHPKIEMIHHNVSMTDVFNYFDLIVTVTGTVAIESILSNKPVVNLIKTLNNTVKNCIYLDDLKELPAIIDMVKNNNFPTATDAEKATFINLLNRTSYYGNVSDPLSDKNCIAEENIEIITKAFEEVLA